MPIVPPNRLEKVQFYENHLNPWGINAAAIGLTAQEVGDLATLTIAARGAYNQAEMARQESKAATAAFYEAVRDMHNGPGAGSDLIKTIQTFAQSTDDTNVYTLAEIPAPQPSSAAPPPGLPFAFSVGLLPIGALELKWKSNNPEGTSGTVYEVARATSGGSTFETVGISGVRSFIDDTITSGSSPVTYQITGVRSTKRGVTAEFTVKFGVAGAQIVSSTTLNDEGIKLAA